MVSDIMDQIPRCSNEAIMDLVKQLINEVSLLKLKVEKLSKSKFDEDIDDNKIWTTNLLCRFHLKGICKYGTQCKYNHKRTMCKFHMKNRCRFGTNCFNNHSSNTQVEAAKIATNY